ncbi:hypothetical protein JKF63_07397 [Porcisia hertigi]|uniref:Uncharacterized protein n=1 Tax=Porcisia hertigi TaxID=2761500 RepID=A0A836LKU0_9TRYP|nr:hypothetical protein JKF63_07397 [Porcisia hertigi]
MPSSTISSYAAYLREVALETDATIATGVSATRFPTSPTRLIPTGTTAVVAVPSPRPSTSRHHRDDYNHSSSDHATDPYEDSYAYDYLQMPETGRIGRTSAMKTYGKWKQQCRTPAPIPRSLHRARESAVYPSSAAYTTGCLKTRAAKQDIAHDVDVGTLQLSFERLYAAMKDEGHRQRGGNGGGVVSTERATHPSRRASRSPQRQNRCDGTRPQRSHLDTASPPAWDGDSAVIHIPPIDFGGEDGRCRRVRMKTVRATKGSSRSDKSVAIAENPQSTAATTVASVKVVSPALTSTDTSVLILTPSNPSRPCSQMGSPPHRSRARQHRCPHCPHTCDSCQCDEVPSPVHAYAHGSHSAVVGATGGGRRTCSSSPACRRSSLSAEWATKTASGARPVSKTVTLDSVRLQWPGQPRTTPVRRPSPQQLSSPEGLGYSSRSARRKRRQQSPADDWHHCRHDRHAVHSSRVHHVKTPATMAAGPVVPSRHGRVDQEKNEAALRDIATRTCTCYWAEFSHFTMAVNPASHAADCPYQKHESLYYVKMGLTGMDGDGSGSGSSASTSSQSRCTSLASSPHHCDGSGRRSRSRRHQRKRGTSSTANASARGKNAKPPRAAQLKRALSGDREAKRTWGRAAVMGSAKRRTYMEVIMDAARDAPPVVSGDRSSKVEATASPSLAKNDVRVAAAASPGSFSSTEQGSLPTEGAPPKLEGGHTEAHPPPQPPPSQPVSEGGTAAAAAGEGGAPASVSEIDGNGDATAVDNNRDEAGNRGRRRRRAPPGDGVGTAASSRTLHGGEPLKQEAEPQPLLMGNSLRALSRPRRRPAVGVPGPGSYQVDLAYAVSSAAHGIRGAAIAKAARMPTLKSTTPGPGAYDVYKHEEEARNAVSTEAVAGDNKTVATTTTADGEATNDSVSAGTPATGKQIVAKGVVFARTGDRQLQLQYGDAYVHASTWAKRAAAVPGPGAYNILDSDRYDQSRPMGVARMGFHFAKSADGAHFGVAAVAGAAAPGASLVAPWRDWAGGAYVGTTTSNFVAHPSLAGGDRRIPGQTVTEGTVTVAGSASSAAYAAAAAATAADGGSVWKGVGSGVALRLTSQRFPVKEVDAPTKGDASTLGEPGPGTYEPENAMRWVQRRAPAVSMIFRHDRGPRGPLRSAGGTVDDDSLASAVGSGAALPSLSLASHLVRDDIGFSPGPATYDVHSGEVWLRRRSPQWAFGTVARDALSATAPVSAAAGESAKEFKGPSLDSVGHPGPGAYDIDAGYRALQPSTATALMSTAPRFPVDGSNRVGDEARATEAGLLEDAVHASPGSYNLESGYAMLSERIKGGVMPRAGADARKEVHHEECQGPGPGAYTLPALPPSGPTAYLGMSAPRFSWEQTLMATASNGRLPDPLHTLFLANDRVTPGPGDYDVDAVTSLLHRPGGIISRAPRVSLLVPTGTTSADVGPGSYLLPALPAGRGAVMLTARADAAAESRDAAERPGPGLYDPVDVHAAPTRTFSLARTSARFPGSDPRTDGVGPGAYEVVDLSPPGRSAVIGSAVARPTLEWKEDNGVGMDAAVPGPGAYSPHYDQVEKRAPSVVLTRAPVGRGATEYGSKGDAPMSFNGQHGGDSSGPGPGAYEVRVTRDGQLVDGGAGGGAARFGTAPRSTEMGASPATAAAPGPGAYMPEAYTDMGASFGGAAPSTAVRIGTAPRALGSNANTRATADVPGPGAYEPRSGVVWPAAPSFSFPRTAAAYPMSDMDTPGPGAYITASCAAARAAHFGTALRFVASGSDEVCAYANNGAEHGASLPGPNAYSPTDAAICPTRPAHRFGTAARQLTLASDSAAEGGVGPGAYEIDSGLAHSSQVPTAAAYSFPRAGSHGGIGGQPAGVGGEAAGGAAVFPGPGAYSLEAAYRATLPRTAAATFSGGEAGGISVAGKELSPGPGAYHLPPSFPEGPQWGFGTSTRGVAATADATDVSPSLTTVSPGPGAYDVPVPAPLHSGLQFPKAATAPPTGEASSPGPGAYDVVDAAVRPLVPGVRFGTSVRYASRGDVSAGNVDAAAGVDRGGAQWMPGPGSYSPNINASSTLHPTRTGPTFAQAPRTAPSAPFDAAQLSSGAEGGNIGPGAYDLHGVMAVSAAPAYSFGTAPRMPLAVTSDAATKEDVGPGSYMIEAADAQVLPRAPAHTMASSAPHAPRPQESQSPGPGSYEYPVAIQDHQRSALMLGRHGDSPGTMRNTPGPAAYDTAAALAAVQPSAAAHTFGTAPTQRQPQGAETDALHASPGPGAYDAAAAYTSTQVARQPGGFTIQGRLAASMQGGSAEVPGPGAYNTDASGLSLVAAHRFGTAPRMPSAAHGDAGVGPGAYDLPAPHPTSPSVSFTQAPRVGVVDPYAGNSTDWQSGEVRGGGLGGNTPGPGSYDVGRAIESTQVGGREPSFTIPRGPRPVLRSGDVDASPLVGPGTYDPPDRASLATGAGIGMSFGSAARMHDMAGAASGTTPGPGAYAVASSFNATSAAETAPAAHFGTAMRPLAAVLNENPGPGSYSVADAGTATSAFAMAPSFGHAARQNCLLNTNPGPGAYSLPPTWFGSDGGAAAGPTFGVSERPTPVLNTNPGPGTYHRMSILDSTSAAAGPSFAMGERMGAAAGTNSPGPGAYYNEYWSTTLGSAPGPTFGLAERPGPELNTNPGPGTYYKSSATGTAEGRGISFGLSQRTPQVLHHYPGPGTYFRETLPAAAHTTQPRPRRPTAADTLRKLASLGYPKCDSATRLVATTATTEKPNSG